MWVISILNILNVHYLFTQTILTLRVLEVGLDTFPTASIWPALIHFGVAQDLIVSAELIGSIGTIFSAVTYLAEGNTAAAATIEQGGGPAISRNFCGIIYLNRGE